MVDDLGAARGFGTGGVLLGDGAVGKLGVLLPILSRTAVRSPKLDERLPGVHCLGL